MSRDPSHPALADADWRELLIDGRRIDANVEEAVLDVGLERKIRGASILTLKLHDPGAKLLDSGLFQYDPTRVELDGLVFQLVGLGWSPSGQGSALTCRFEDEEVARLRRFDKPKSASRRQMTRARFIKGLFDEADVEFFCPLLDKPQPVGKASQRPTRTTKDRRREPGIPDDADLTVKGARATSAQRDLAERLLDVARRENAGAKATLALITAAIVESELRNLTGGDRDSVGVLQVRTGLHGRETAADPEASARRFLTHGFAGAGGAIELAKKHPGWTAGQVAQAVQGSAHPDRYDQRREEAQAFVTAYGGGDVPSNGSPSDDGNYRFRRGEQGKREDSWTCANRLADEVNWRLFVIAGRGVYLPDEELLRSRPRMTITPSTPGIDLDEVLIHRGIPEQELSFTCQAERWAAPPGTVVQTKEMGAANGRWIVRTIDRPSLASTVAKVTVGRKQAWKPEPKPEPKPKPVTTQPATTSGDSSAAPGITPVTTDSTPTGLAVDSQVMLAYRRAQQITSQRLSYVWGGGHGQLGVPGSKSGIVHEGGGAGRPGVIARGFDCSGGVSAVLGAARLLSSPLTAASFLAWGKPGKGKYLTVWVRQTGNPRTDHVLIVFTLPGKSAETFEFGGSGKTGLHAGRSLSGFYPRHWPGT